MSVALDNHLHTWQTQPGWGISVDITPRQVVQARQVKNHRRLIGLVLGLVLVACAGASLLVLGSRDGAQRSYDDEQTRTTALSREIQQYADITAMQDTTERVQSDLTTALATDVDIVHLMARVNQAVPPGVEIKSQAVVLTPVETTPDQGADPAGDAAPAPAGPQVIGTLTVGGSANQLEDVTPFIAALTQLRGAVDVVPASVAQNDAGATYSITMNITDVLYTHRYAEKGSS